VRKYGLVLASVAGLAISNVPAMADAAQQAQPAQPAAANPAPNPAADEDKIVCRNLGAPTGTRLGGRRECRTQREWDDVRHQDANEISKMQARDALGPSGH
jgi:hypothetical protein